MRWQIGGVDEGEAGGYLYELLHAYGLCAVNSFYDSGPTFFRSDGAAAKDDYICIPQSLLPKVEWCEVLRPIGKRLQIIKDDKPRDHLPLGVGVA